MKPNPTNSLFAHLLRGTLASVIVIAGSAQAAEIAYRTPATSTAEATLAANWGDGSAAPGASDIAAWTTAGFNGESRGGIITVSSPVSWGGIRAEDSTGPLTLTGSPITLGSSGIPEVRWEVFTINNNLVLGADQTWSNDNLLTVNGAISGAFGITKGGAGGLTLTGANTFSGPFAISTGTATVSSLNRVTGGAASSSLGKPATVADGTISLSAGGSQAALIYTGSGETSDRVIDLASGSGGIITANGSGPLVLTSPMTGANAAMGVTLNGGGAGTMNGITDTGALINFNKSGISKWTVNGSLTLHAGAIRPQGGILAFSPTAFTTGTDAVISGRSNGGVLQIASGSGIVTSTANTNGILGGWATFGNSTWAVTNGSGAINGLASFTNDVWSAVNNTNVTSGGANPAAGSTTNSLRFNTAAAKTLTLAGTNTVTSGGILVTPAVGANAVAIDGGTLMGAASADLVVHQNNTAGSLTISSIIANNTAATGLTKTGAGALVLGGANTYTGTTRVHEGKLTVDANSGGKIYEVASSATLELGYDTGGTVYGYGATVYGAGTAATSGLYLKGGSSLTLTSTLRLASAPSTVRTYGTGNATLQAWDSNPVMLQVDATASGSVLVPAIRLLSTNYGYRMNIASGQFSATGDVAIQGPLEGDKPYIKVGAGSAKLTGAGTDLARFDVQQGSIILSGGNDRLAAGSSVNLGNGGSSGSLILDGISQTLTDISISGTGAQNSVVGRSSTLSTLVINNSGDSTMGAIVGGPGANQNNLALVKSNTGVLTVTGNNTFTGGATISAGTLVLGSPGALGISGAITLSGGTLQYTAANTTDYTAGGRLKIGDGVTSSLDTNGQDVILANPVAYGVSGTGVLTKTGAGALVLNYSPLNASKLSDTATLGLGGGILRLTGGSHQEIVGGTLVTGSTTIERTTGTATISLGALSRTGSATLDIAGNGIVRTSTANDGSGKLPAWVTVNGAPAANDGSGNIVAYSGFADIFRLGGKIPNNPAANIRIINGGVSGNITLLNSGLSDISTLLQNATAGPAVVDLGSNTLRLGEAGAIIVPSGSGNLTIQSGRLTAGGANDVNGDIAIDSDEKTTIASTIDNNGENLVSLSKSGSARWNSPGKTTTAAAPSSMRANFSSATTSALDSGLSPSTADRWTTQPASR